MNLYIYVLLVSFTVCRVEHTMLRINSININGKLNERKEFEGLDRIF